MLKLSARGDYGLLLVGYLAGLRKGQYASLATVASERRLPLKYLERLARRLLAGHLVVSRQGKVGGYALAQPAGKLKLIDVLRALEGELEPVRCTHDGRCCERQAACERKTGYQKVHSKLYGLLARYTLADILPTITVVDWPSKP
ncbi:MAG: Rrf2 family transcriptional regulator [Candidatus Kerfeldbacteria bacterium]|nr:Rrf2 family transcriptional regulator [Candidatus Kerfeldbacteria bacterium]